MIGRRLDRWWMWAAAVLMMTLLVAGCAKKDDKKDTLPKSTDGSVDETGADTQDKSATEKTTEESTKDESVKEETTKQPAGAEAGKEETTKQPAGVEAGKEETAKQPAGVETGKEEVTKQPAGVTTAMEESEKEQAKEEEESSEASANAVAPPPPGEEGSTAVVKVPLGLPALPIPDDNPMSVDKVELGKLLYFDKRLSKDGTVACATCHDPNMAWAEHTPTSKGIGGQVGGANSPTVINAAYAKAQFWDGRAATLEEQALGPIENPIEMGHKLDELIPQLNAIEGYKQRFQKVFDTDVTKEGIAKAIASFERTVLSGNSPYDRFVAGDESALNEIQQKGMELFKELRCSTCHRGEMFSGYGYYNAGIGMDKEKPDEGRMAVTKDEKDLGKYRVPSLREVANTAPYFHDGSCDTLEKAVAAMAGGGIANDNLSSVLKQIGTKEVSAEDQAAIVEFLKALSGEFPVVKPPALP